MAELEVFYSREGSKHTITTGNRALGNIVIDTEGIPVEERNGTAKQLLAASTLYCYCSALVLAMETRAIEYKNIKASAKLVAGNNEKAQSRVLNIDLDVHVEIDEDDLDMFERIQKIMKNGCLVTSSVHDGIHMNYNLVADCKD